jgi:hypothetical protein
MYHDALVWPRNVRFLVLVFETRWSVVVSAMMPVADSDHDQREVDDGLGLYTPCLPVTFSMCPSFHEPNAYLPPGNVLPLLSRMGEDSSISRPGTARLPQLIMILLLTARVEDGRHFGSYRISTARTAEERTDAGRAEGCVTMMDVG